MGQQPVFENKVLLEYGHPTCLCIIYMCFCDYRVQHLQQKLKQKMFTVWSLQQKFANLYPKTTLLLNFGKNVDH